MKKVIILSLAVMLLIASCATSISADDTPKTTEVSFSNEETYTWAVPAAVEFTDSSLEKTGDVEVSALVLTAGKQLEISMSSESCAESATTYKLSTDAGVTHDYSVKAGSTEVPNKSVVLTATADEGAGIETNAKKVTLTFATEKLTFAGEFKDTLTFTAAINDIPTTD